MGVGVTNREGVTDDWFWVLCGCQAFRRECIRPLAVVKANSIFTKV